MGNTLGNYIFIILNSNFNKTILMLGNIPKKSLTLKFKAFLALGLLLNVSAQNLLSSQNAGDVQISGKPKLSAQPTTAVAMNTTVQYCPDGCTACDVDPKDPGSLICKSCQPDFMMLDDPQKTCIPRCDRKQEYFDKTNKYCVPCVAPTFPDQQNQRCQRCSKFCNDCSFDLTSLSERCNACSPGTFLDDNYGKCRTACNSTSVYNFTIQACTKCTYNQFLDPRDLTCKKCPQNCSTCEMYPGLDQPVCKSCEMGFQYDPKAYKCRSICKANQIYDWQTDLCTSCPPGTFYDTKAQDCFPCPQNCTQCVLDSNTFKVSCKKCSAVSILDSKTNLCKPICPDSQVYNWGARECQACNEGTFYNPLTQSCNDCPNNCKSCYINSQKLGVECSECKNSTLTFDTIRKFCRVTCQPYQIYNYTSNKCQSCPLSTQYADPSQNKCVNCPKNTTSCKLSDGNILVSTACAPNFVIDQTTNLCRPSCTANQQFDFSTYLCRACLKGQYLNNSTGACNDCPANCPQCNWNSLNKRVECQACLNGEVLDSDLKLCRPPCPSSKVYNWTTSQCGSCPTTSYVLLSNQTCQKCPANCTSCSYNSKTNKPECGSCTNGNVIDVTSKICRPSCESDSFYNVYSQKCLKCLDGLWLNQTTQSCQKCPTNCISCEENVTTNVPTCTLCFRGLVIDRGTCRKTCLANQYFDWQVSDCKNCSTECSTCTTDFKTCTTCKEGFQFNKTQGFGCFERCNKSEGKMWDPVLKTCVEQQITLQLTQGQLTVVVNTTFSYKQWANRVAEMAFEWVPKFSQALYNSDKPVISTLQISIDQFADKTTVIVYPGFIYLNSEYVKQQNISDIDYMTLLLAQAIRPQKPQFMASNQRQLPQVQTKWLERGLASYASIYIYGDGKKVPASDYALNYTNSTTSSAVFLKWLVDNKRANIVQEINIALARYTYIAMGAESTWFKLTGQTLDSLWSEFLRVTGVTAISIQLSPFSPSTLRCRNQTISAIAVGGDILSKYPVDFAWSVSLVEGSQSYREFDYKVIRTSNTSTEFTLSKTFTEKVVSQIKLKVSLTATVAKTLIFKNETTITIIPETWQVLNISTKEYTIQSGDSFQLYPYVSNPECISFKYQGQAALLKFNCILQDSQGINLGQMPNCKLNQTVAAGDYFVSYIYSPSILQPSISDRVKLTVQGLNSQPITNETAPPENMTEGSNHTNNSAQNTSQNGNDTTIDQVNNTDSEGPIDNNTSAENNTSPQNNDTAIKQNSTNTTTEDIVQESTASQSKEASTTQGNTTDTSTDTVGNTPTTEEGENTNSTVDGQSTGQEETANTTTDSTDNSTTNGSSTNVTTGESMEQEETVTTIDSTSNSTTNGSSTNVTTGEESTANDTATDSKKNDAVNESSVIDNSTDSTQENNNSDSTQEDNSNESSTEDDSTNSTEDDTNTDISEDETVTEPSTDETITENQTTIADPSSTDTITENTTDDVTMDESMANMLAVTTTTLPQDQIRSQHSSSVGRIIVSYTPQSLILLALIIAVSCGVLKESKNVEYLSVVPNSAQRQGENSISDRSITKIPQTDAKENGLLMRILSHSKVYKFLQATTSVPSKLTLASVWLSAFFFSALFVQEITQMLSLAVVTYILSLLCHFGMAKIEENCISSQVKTLGFVIFSSVSLLVQTLVSSQLIQNYQEASLSLWLGASFIALFLSNVVKDLLIKPLYAKLHQCFVSQLEKKNEDDHHSSSDSEVRA